LNLRDRSVAADPRVGRFSTDPMTAGRAPAATSCAGRRRCRRVRSSVAPASPPHQSKSHPKRRRRDLRNNARPR